MRKPRKTVWRVTRWVLTLTSGFLIALLAWVLIANVGPLNSLVAADVLRSEAQSQLGTPKKLIVILVKDETFKKLGLPIDLTILPPHIDGDLLKKLDSAGARAALLDVVLQHVHPDDREFHDDVVSLKNLRLTLATTCDEQKDITSTDEGLECTFHPLGTWPYPQNDRVAIGSVFSLQDQSQGILGFVPRQKDPTSKATFWSAPFVIQAQARGESPSRIAWDPVKDVVTDGPLEWQLAAGQMFNRSVNLDKLEKYEFTEALRLLDDPKGRQRFQDSIVVIGQDRPNQDRAAIGGKSDIPGSLVLAESVYTAMQPFTEQHREVPDLFVIGVMGAIASLTLLSIFGLRGWQLAVVLGLAALTSYTAPEALSRFAEAYFPMPPVILAFILALLAGLLTRQIVPHVTRNPKTSKAVDSTVMFLDLVGSTKLLNEIGAFRYQTLLTDLFHEYPAIVERAGGVTARTLGDGFLAIFSTGPDRHHSLRALDAAKVLIQHTSEVASRHQVDLYANVGIESGPVLGGWVEENERRSWSSSGPTVVIAQRIESLCRTHQVSIAIGPVARRYIQIETPCKTVATSPIKGFVEPIEISTLA